MNGKAITKHIKFKLVLKPGFKPFGPLGLLRGFILSQVGPEIVSKW